MSRSPFLLSSSRPRHAEQCGTLKLVSTRLINVQLLSVPFHQNMFSSRLSGGNIMMAESPSTGHQPIMAHCKKAVGIYHPPFHNSIGTLLSNKTLLPVSVTSLGILIPDKLVGVIVRRKLFRPVPFPSPHPPCCEGKAKSTHKVCIFRRSVTSVQTCSTQVITR